VLSPDDIRHFKLSKARVAAYLDKAPPAYECRDNNTFLNAVGEAALARVLGVSDDDWDLQSNDARCKGLSYVVGDLGISVLTSKVREPSRLSNLVVIPKPRLDCKDVQHVIVAVFTTKDVKPGAPVKLKVAGWLPVEEIDSAIMPEIPAGFHSRIPVALVRATSLKPIRTLCELVNNTKKG
jgi:hypothetical protein